MIKNNRIPLPNGTQLTKDVRILNLLSEEGNSGLVYNAILKGAFSMVVKEYFPLYHEIPVVRNGYKIEAANPEDSEKLREILKEKAAFEFSNAYVISKASEDDTKPNGSILSFSDVDITNEVIEMHPDWKGTVARYFLCESCYGRSLAELIMEKDFGLEQALLYTKRLIRSVFSNCHSKGILHLDIKLENIYIPLELTANSRFTDESYMILLDTANARPVECEKRQKLPPISVSSEYCAPELARYKMYMELGEVEAAKEMLQLVAYDTDIYSMMSVCFRMLMGFAFDNEKWQKITNSAMVKKRERLIKEELIRKLGEDFYLIERLTRFLAKGLYCVRQEERFNNCDELLIEINAIQDMMNRKGYHAEVVFENSRRIFAERYKETEINEEWIANTEQ